MTSTSSRFIASLNPWARAVLPGALALLTVGLGGCHEFQGEQGVLWFSSNLTLGPDGAWHPGRAIASGTTAIFTAEGRVDEESSSGEALQVEGAVAGDLEQRWRDDTILAVSGAHGQSGVVFFDGDASDRFGVAFARPEGATLVAPGSNEVGEEFALIVGSVTPLQVTVLDNRGWELGWSHEDLTVTGRGALSTWIDSGAVMIAADSQAGEVGQFTVSLLGQELGSWSVSVVEEADVHTLSLTADPSEGLTGERQTLLQVQGALEDGTPVWGIQPDWTWDADVKAEVVEGVPGALLVHEVDQTRVSTVEARAAGQVARLAP